MNEGIIQHSYINASEQPGQYAADQCGRQAVTVRWLFNCPDCDMTYFTFNKEADDLGGNPWRLMDSVDKRSDEDKYDLWPISGCPKTVAGDTVIYVQVKDLLKLGITPPPRLGILQQLPQ